MCPLLQLRPTVPLAVLPNWNPNWIIQDFLINIIKYIKLPKVPGQPNIAVTCGTISPQGPFSTVAVLELNHIITWPSSADGVCLEFEQTPSADEDHVI